MLSAGKDGTSTVETSLSDTLSGAATAARIGCCGTSCEKQQAAREKTKEQAEKPLLQAAIVLPLVVV
jgi:hypothetical protein